MDTLNDLIPMLKRHFDLKEPESSIQLRFKGTNVFLKKDKIISEHGIKYDQILEVCVIEEKYGGKEIKKN